MDKLLVIVGPTGTGKTDLALRLAKKFNGELVSADSRQVYTGMDVGTGKELKTQNSSVKTTSQNLEIKKEKGKWLVNDIPIYLYDVVKPDQRFSLAEYQQLALEKIKEIHSRNKLPILVGGTGLYIQSVTEGLKIPKAPPDQGLRNKLEEERLDELLAALKKVDPVYYEKVDKNNKRRVIRALEVFQQTGESFSVLQKKYKVDFDILKIGLIGEREDLYEKVDNRIDSWFEQGFIEEVENLLKRYSSELPAMSSLGYRQVTMYLNKNLSLEEAKQRMKFEHHGYIRRQTTWFRRDANIYWFDIFSDESEKEIEGLIKNWQAKEN